MAATAVLGVSFVVALAVGGCNGDGEGSISQPSTTTVVGTTTTLTPTTIDPLAAEEAAVSEAAEQARLARTNALVNPDDPAALAALDRFYVSDGPARAEVDRSLADLASQGWSVRTHPTVPETVTVEQITFSGTPPTQAALVVCIIDPAIVYEPNSAPGGGETIIDDTVYAYRSVYQMSKVDGAWKLSDVSLIEEWQGVDQCPRAS
jgi:hypothetical protein